MFRPGLLFVETGRNRVRERHVPTLVLVDGLGLWKHHLILGQGDRNYGRNQASHAKSGYPNTGYSGDPKTGHVRISNGRHGHSKTRPLKKPDIF